MHGSKVRLGMQDMTRDRLLALLKKCEQATNSGDEYSPACAVCELYTHAPDCELKAAIDWLEDPHARFDVTVGEVLDDLFGPAK